MDCALSDYPPLATTGIEVFECIVRGGLAAPNDVHLKLTSLIIGLPDSCGS
jgi:hypothetical protein